MWGYVPARNPGFTGRETLLAAIRKTLSSGDRAVTYALQGMGGVLARCHPALIIEVLGAGENLAAVRSLLEPLGYSNCSYFTECGLVPIDDGCEGELGGPNFLFL